MTYAQALKDCKRTGTSKATGAALAAMYASLIPALHCISKSQVPKIYAHLATMADDSAIIQEARRLLRDPDAVLGLLWGEA